MEKLGINTSYLITQIINFTILVIVLGKFVYKPILTSLENRRKKIQEGLDLTEKLTKDKEELDQKAKIILNQAQKEAKVVIEKARDQGKKVEQEIIKEGRLEAENIIARGKKDVEIRGKEMEDRLSRETVDIAVSLTQKVIGEILDSKKQEVLLKKRLDYFLNHRKLH